MKLLTFQTVCLTRDLVYKQACPRMTWSNHTGPKSEAKIMESSQFENRLFIDGEFRIPESDKKFELFNPATTERVASVYEAGAEEVNLAVKAAVQAFDSWSEVGAAERSRWLNRFADKLEENAGELSRLEALTMGRPTHNDFVRKRGTSIIFVIRKLTRR